MVSLAVSIAVLIAPLFIGVGLGRARLFADAHAAIDALNRLALYVAFPALVIVGLSNPHTAIAHHPAFLAIVPLSLGIALLTVRGASLLAGRIWQGAADQAGTIALVVAFGNTAYLGLPYVEAVLGPDALATASVAVSLHVATAMITGPVLLARWSGSSATLSLSGLRGRLARHPLLWSPLIGLALRALPIPALTLVRSILDPLGRLAAPVSMVLLGLYLHEHRAKLRLDGSVVSHSLARLVLVPVVTFALVLPADIAGWIDATEARVLMLLAAMPGAVTTFAIALEEGIGADRVAAAVVASTIASAITLPLATWLAMAL